MLEEFLTQFPLLEVLTKFGIFDMTGIAIGAFLTIWFVRSEKERRKREEEYYESETKSNLHEILKHFVEVDVMSKNELSEEEPDLEEKIDPDQVVLELNRYYKQNYRKMEMLLDNTKMALSRWSRLNSADRVKYNEIINDFEWLVKEYFSPTKPENIQTRMWSNQRQVVTTKRYEIDKQLETLIDQ